MVNGEVKNIQPKYIKSSNFCFAKILLFTIYYLLFSMFPFSTCYAFGAQKSKVYTPESQYKHQQKVLREEEKEKYEQSLLPESGLMTKAEYEAKSKDISNSDRDVPEYKPPINPNMKFVPQYTYKITHYNDPPGSPEIHIGEDFKRSKKFVAPGVTSPDKSFLVYPTLDYFPNNDCVAGSLYVVPLDKTLPVVERIQRANLVKRNPQPILATQNTIDERNIFRSMTPIDFSSSGNLLLAKEKIGSNQDGIWKTNIWVYNFDTKQAREIPEVREAIEYYWRKAIALILDEKRWDIYPVGFSVDEPNRILLYAYGYTGDKPKFLGTWSVDSDGSQSRLESLFDGNVKVSINGFKIVVDGCVDPAIVYNEAKRQEKLDKQHKKTDKKAVKRDKKLKKQAYKKRIKEMKAEERKVLKDYRKLRSHSFVNPN